MALPLALPLILGAVGSVASGVMQAGAATRSAKLQAEASREAAATQERLGLKQIASAEKIAGQQMDLARDIESTSRQDLDPWRQVGRNSLLMYARKVNKPFEESDAYKFQMDQGIKALENSAAGRGGLFSGNTQKSLINYGQGLASQEYGNYLNRLAGLADAGQGAAARQAGFSLQTGNTMNNALAGQGAYTNQSLGGIGNALASGQINAANAQASGIMGSANALSGMFGNLTNLAGYHSTMFPQAYG